MPKPRKAVAERPQFGPLMGALDPDRRSFVVALFNTSGNRAAAARLCGWNRMKGSRFAHEPAVQQAIGEYGREHLALHGPQMIKQIVELAKTGKPAIRLKAAGAVLDRGGLGAVINVAHKHQVTVSYEEKIERLKELVRRNGGDVDAVIASLAPRPETTDAEVEE